MAPRFKVLDIALVIVSFLLLVSFGVSHIIVVPAMRDTFNEFGVAVPNATEFALSVTNLVIVEAIGAALVFGATLSFWRAKRSRGLLFAVLSLLFTFAMSIFFVFAVSLPAATSVVAPDAEKLDP